MLRNGYYIAATFLFCFLVNGPSYASDPYRYRELRNDVVERDEENILDLTLIAEFERPFAESVANFDPKNWANCSRHFRGSEVISSSSAGPVWQGILRLRERMMFVLGVPTAGYLSDFNIQTQLTENQYHIDYELRENYEANFMAIDLSGSMTMNDGYVDLKDQGDNRIRLTITKRIKLDLEPALIREMFFQFKSLLPPNLSSMAKDIATCGP